MCSQGCMGLLLTSLLSGQNGLVTYICVLRAVYVCFYLCFIMAVGAWYLAQCFQQSWNKYVPWVLTKKLPFSTLVPGLGGACYLHLCSQGSKGLLLPIFFIRARGVCYKPLWAMREGHNIWDNNCKEKTLECDPPSHPLLISWLAPTDTPGKEISQTSCL